MQIATRKRANPREAGLLRDGLSVIGLSAGNSNCVALVIGKFRLLYQSHKKFNRSFCSV
jgi:hypothetical protein